MLRVSGSIDIEGCPVAEEFLNTLLRLTPTDVTQQTNALPDDQRGRLAVYCYRRSHLRRLGLTIASQCSRRSLVEEAGHAGELIHFQATNMAATLASDTYMSSRIPKRQVSLHKV
jgi:hypothetical protein